MRFGIVGEILSGLLRLAMFIVQLMLWFVLIVTAVLWLSGSL